MITMKINALYGSLLLISLTLLTSCKKEEEETKTLDPNKQIILPRVAPIPATSTYVQPNNPQTVTQQQPAQTITPGQQVANQKQVVTKPGMNPPHGQAGHRCDIAVGAPLNSKPNATATPSQPAFTKTVIPNAAQQAKSAGTATTTAGTPALLNPTTAGTNPPHGQPGHVCGTPVTPAASTPETAK